MNENTFKLSIGISAAIFLAVFALYTAPAALVDGDIIGAFTAGFVNPFAAGYSTDVIMCWFIMSAWILYERKQFGYKYGPLCMALGLVPGVAVGFALYLYLRTKQETHRLSSDV
ncbi:hypothetical protein A3762_04540 [Oleiphilus sp. HI0125]|uniref:DUF2834 domain-containing protein n=1 Tax=Oleiphilus sp. HI0125 TaxID=1822266 RepID=UPI0007C2B3E6|nr:DUF2834 domain-containing protein [Oleiphilus sp. HI0125]KZZ57219.1 hypothetical protein A3762_20015 [Oleiphilus sp. HI0125]KZZ59650.1 hypothetical protein A3762_04540 [Oleiphilus sp. HI0125]